MCGERDGRVSKVGGPFTRHLEGGGIEIIMRCCSFVRTVGSRYLNKPGSNSFNHEWLDKSN